MDTTEFGVPTRGGVADAPIRRCARLVRRVLTLLGLVLGWWLIGVVLHAGTAGAAPATPDGPPPPALVAHLRPTTDALATVARRATGHEVAGATHAAGHEVVGVTHAAGHEVVGLTHAAVTVGRPAVRAVQRTAGIASRVIGHRGLTVRHTLSSIVAPIVNPFVNAAVRHVVTPVAVAVLPIALAGRTDRPSSTVRAATVSVAGTSLNPAGAALSLPPLSAARVVTHVAPLSWSLDTAPPSPHAPQPLPYSPGGSVAAGGTVPSGHENGAAPVSAATTRGATGHRPAIAVGTVPSGTDGKRPSFSPD